MKDWALRRLPFGGVPYEPTEKGERKVHATIQKPLDEILSALRGGEQVMVVGRGSCAAEAKSGGEPEAQAMVR